MKLTPKNNIKKIEYCLPQFCLSFKDKSILSENSLDLEIGMTLLYSIIWQNQTLILIIFRKITV